MSATAARRSAGGVKLSVEYINRKREIVCVGIELSADEANALAKQLHQAANR